MFNLLLFKDVYFIKYICSTDLLLILHVIFYDAMLFSKLGAHGKECVWLK